MTTNATSEHGFHSTRIVSFDKFPGTSYLRTIDPQLVLDTDRQLFQLQTASHTTTSNAISSNPNPQPPPQPPTPPSTTIAPSSSSTGASAPLTPILGLKSAVAQVLASSMEASTSSCVFHTVPRGSSLMPLTSLFTHHPTTAASSHVNSPPISPVNTAHPTAPSTCNTPNRPPLHNPPQVYIPIVPVKSPTAMRALSSVGPLQGPSQYPSNGFGMHSPPRHKPTPPNAAQSLSTSMPPSITPPRLNGLAASHELATLPTAVVSVKPHEAATHEIVSHEIVTLPTAVVSIVPHHSASHEFVSRKFVSHEILTLPTAVVALSSIATPSAASPPNGPIHYRSVPHVQLSPPTACASEIVLKADASLEPTKANATPSTALIASTITTAVISTTLTATAPADGTITRDTTNDIPTPATTAKTASEPPTATIANEPAHAASSTEYPTPASSTSESSYKAMRDILIAAIQSTGKGSAALSEIYHWCEAHRPVLLSRKANPKFNTQGAMRLTDSKNWKSSVRANLYTLACFRQTIDKEWTVLPPEQIAAAMATPSELSEDVLMKLSKRKRAPRAPKAEADQSNGTVNTPASGGSSAESAESAESVESAEQPRRPPRRRKSASLQWIDDIDDTKPPRRKRKHAVDMSTTSEPAAKRRRSLDGFSSDSPMGSGEEDNADGHHDDSSNTPEEAVDMSTPSRRMPGSTKPKNRNSGKRGPPRRRYSSSSSSSSPSRSPPSSRCHGDQWLMESTSSPLTELDLKDVVNEETWMTRLTRTDREALRPYLPPCDTGGEDGGDNGPLEGALAAEGEARRCPEAALFKNAYFREMLTTFQDMLRRGEFDPEMADLRSMVRKKKERREKRPAWKDKYFEEYWGQRLTLEQIKHHAESATKHNASTNGGNTAGQATTSMAIPVAPNNNAAPADAKATDGEPMQTESCVPTASPDPSMSMRETAQGTGMSAVS